MPYIPETLTGDFFRKTIENDPEPESVYWFRRDDGEIFGVVESARHAGDTAPVILDDGRPTGNTVGESLFVVTDDMRQLADVDLNDQQKIDHLLVKIDPLMRDLADR